MSVRTGGTIPRHNNRIRLSEAGAEVLIASLRGGLHCRDIAAKLAALGECMCERTIARRRAELRAEEGRAEALRYLGQERLAGWSIEEMLSLVESVDITDGWWLRSRRRVLKELDRFFSEATAAGIHAIEAQLLAFAVAAHLAQRRRQKRNHDGAVILPERGSSGMSASLRLSKEGGTLLG